MILKLAFRNLFANKVKSAIIVALMALATFLTVLGFGILSYSKIQTESVCRSDYCGDIFISGKTKRGNSAVVEPTLFGAMASGVVFEAPDMPYLLQVEKILQKLKSINNISDFSMGVTVSGIIKPVQDENEIETTSYQSQLDKIILANFLGINPKDHKRMYNSIKITEGSIPETGEFLVIPNERRELYNKKYQKVLNIGDAITLSTYSTNKPKTITMKVSAFYDYAHPETDIEGVCYIDINSARVLGNMTVGSQTASEIPENIDLSLVDLSEEELFSENFGVVQSANDYTEPKNTTTDDLLNILGDTQLRDTLNMPDSNSWHYITVKLNNRLSTNSIINELNRFFDANSIEAQAVGWEKAMLFFSMKLEATKTLLIIILVLLSIVSLVVIMNTLVVSIMERTGEIGTMRAIGAKKSFVRKMFFSESFVLGISGLFIGLVLAFIVSLVFNMVGMPSGTIGESLFGFSVIRVNLGLNGIGLTSLIIIVASLLATIYPLAVAMQISPLEAMNKN